VIAPRDNERDFAKLPATLRHEVEFIWASSMDQVIAEAILLDEVQVGSLLEGSHPAVSGDPRPATDGFAPPDEPPYGDNVAAEGSRHPGEL